MDPPELAGQRLHHSVPAGLPEVDVRPALVVLPAGPAHAIFLRIFHHGLPIRHVLCYTFAHEGYSSLSSSWYRNSTITHEVLSLAPSYSSVQDVLYSYSW